MASYKLIVKNAKVILKTVTNSVLNITGIKDLLTGSGSVDSNTKIDWTLQHYTNTAANFTSINPILLVGQVGIETDDLLTAPKYKIGDGLTAWNTLPYNSSGGSGLSGLTTNKVLKATSSTTVGNSNITDDSTSITISSPNNQNLVVVEDNNLYIQYLGTTNAGGLTYLNTYVDLQHDVRVNLNAPSVTKNGVEVATVNNIPTVDTTIIDGSTNAVSGNAVFDGLATKADNLLTKINSTITHTGTTAATIINTSTFLSGLQPNDFLLFEAQLAAINNANNKRFTIYFNTSHSLVGATLVATYVISSGMQGSTYFTRTLNIGSALNINTVYSPSISINNEKNYHGSVGLTALNYDLTNGVYVMLVATNVSSVSDTLTLYNFKARIER